MRLITTYFDYPGQRVFSNLMKLMKYSFQKNRLKLECVKMPTPPGERNKQLESNHEKLKVWAKFLDESNQDIIFLDTDMYCMRDFRYGMKRVKHIGLTYRTPGTGFPINGGVVFVKNNEGSKNFFKEWIAADKWMYDNPEDHAPWREKYAGINQSSLGYILEEKGMNKLATKLQCTEFNCVEPWYNWRQSCLIHVKSRLRRAWQGNSNGATLSVKSCAKFLRSESRRIGINPSMINALEKKTPSPEPQKVH
jgi:hypothetical protein